MLPGSRRVALLLACLALPLAAAAPPAPPLPGRGPEPDHVVSCNAPCVAVHEPSPTLLDCGFQFGIFGGTYTCITADGATPPNVRTFTCVSSGMGFSCSGSGSFPRTAPYSAACVATAGSCRIQHV